MNLFKKIQSIVLSVLFCAICVPAAALDIPDDVPSWKGLGAETLAAMLDYGDIIAVDAVGDGGIEMVSMGMLADATPGRVWEVITDFDGYTDLMPGTMLTKTRETDGNTAVVDFEVNVVKAGPVAITTKYALKYNLDAPKRLDISWVEGEVKNVEGYWQLYPLDGGKKTFAIYAITSDLGSTKIVGSALAKQPATVMAINLSSAIVFTEKIMEEAEGRPRPTAPEGSDTIWRKLDAATLNKLAKGGRVGFISRIGDMKVASSVVHVSKSPEKVWEKLVDFEQYPDKIQQIKRANILEMDEKHVKVKMLTEVINLGLIKIKSSAETAYNFDKPNTMWSEDDKNPALFNRWELVALGEGSETALINESISDISGMGMIAKTMLDKIPAIQISIDLSQGMIMANELMKWAEGE